MKLRKIKMAIKTLLILCLLTLIALVTYQNCYIFTQNKWEVKSYTTQSVNGAILPSFREKVAIKAMIENEFNIPHLYFDYTETWEVSVIGRAIPQLNLVFVDKDLDGFNYATTLAHELAHCKYQSANECYTEYMAITTLLNSDCDWLKSVGEYWKRWILSGVRQGSEYDCGWYLLNMGE